MGKKTKETAAVATTGEGEAPAKKAKAKKAAPEAKAAKKAATKKPAKKAAKKVPAEAKEAKPKKAKAEAKPKKAAAKKVAVADDVSAPAAPLAFTKKLLAEHGPCTAVRAVAEKFKSLQRGEMLAIARELEINPSTASIQFHRTRSGQVQSGL